MTDFKLDENDLLVEIFRYPPTGNLDEDFARMSFAPVRIIHKPTGISAIGEEQVSQIKNKEKAIELLKELLAKQEISNKE